MGKLAFLTPESLTAGEQGCVTINIPAHLFRYLVGALAELAEIYNWERQGSTTPAECADYFNELLLATNWGVCLMEKALFWRDSAFAIPHNLLTPVTFNNQERDSDYYQFDNEVVTVLQGGVYLAVGSGVWAANSTGVRRLSLTTTGATPINLALSQQNAPVAGIVGQNPTFFGRLQANDQFFLWAFQNSGSALNLGASNSWPWLSVMRLHE